MDNKKIKVLFVCVHNSARSQMAEAFLNKYGQERFYAESAGLEPGNLNPIVVEVMKEDGIDISKNSTKSVFELYKEGRAYDYVITVCDKEAGEKCPIFPGKVFRLNWFFDDPSKFKGDEEEIKLQITLIRNKIKSRIMQFIEETY